MKKLKQKYRCIEELKYGNDKTTRCPTKTLGHDRQAGFTLVELVIVIAIVIILSVISVPIYRGYVDKAKMAEGYALLGTIISAQKAYYSEYGNFYIRKASWASWETYDEVLGVDARGNRYFSLFTPSGNDGGGGQSSTPKVMFGIHLLIPEDIRSGDDKKQMRIIYNVTKNDNKIEEGYWGH